MDRYGYVDIVLVDEEYGSTSFRQTRMDYVYLRTLDGCNSVYANVDSMFAMWF